MSLPEVEVDRITRQVFAARNSGLDAALVKVVIDEIENATAELRERVADLEYEAGMRDRLVSLFEERFTDAEAAISRVEALADSAGDLDNGILVWDLRAALRGGS